MDQTGMDGSEDSVVLYCRIQEVKSKAVSVTF